MFNFAVDDFTVLSRSQIRSLTLVDIFRTKEELKRINMMTGTYITLKCGQELRMSYPARLIKSQSCMSMELPGAHFVRSRFHNLQIDKEKHERAFKENMQARGFNNSPTLISPLSPISWCIVNTAHQGLALKRQTVSGSHWGYGKVAVNTDKFVRIAKLKALVKEVRESCIICKSELNIAISLQPGKCSQVATLAPSSHHTAAQLDLLPSVKLSNWPGQKVTRNATKFVVHILISVDMTTKYADFSLINTRSTQDLVEGITALASKIGRNPG